MNLQEIELLRQRKTIAAVHATRGNGGLHSLATGATLPGARQRIEIDPDTGYPVEDDPDSESSFLAGDIVGEKAV